MPMADRDSDPASTEMIKVTRPADTDKLTLSGEAGFELNQFGESVLTRVRRGSSGAAPDPVMPAAIGRYEIRGLLGCGGFGAVYRGYDRHLDRQVAVKVPLLKATKGLEEIFPDEARKLA